MTAAPGSSAAAGGTAGGVGVGTDGMPSSTSGAVGRTGVRGSAVSCRTGAFFSDPRYKKARRKKAAPSVYSEADAAQVQHILSRIGHKPVCPVCEGTFTLGPVDKRGWEAVRQVACADCGRSTVVSNCVLARVMVVTRIEAVSQMLRTILTSVGHEVIEPPHTGAALDIYRENAADVVVMDTYALAEMAGQEFIRQLCNEFSDPRVLVLAARSSYRTADPSATAMQLGATLILRTPFSREELFQAVKEARQ